MKISSGNPDKLHQQVLTWDYFSDSNFPQPHPALIQYPDIPFVQLEDIVRKNGQVPSTFKFFTSHTDIFEPLSVLECWNSILKSKIDSVDIPFVAYVETPPKPSQMYMVFSVVIKSNEISKVEIFENDLVLLSHFPDGSAFSRRSSKDRPYCFALIEKIKFSPKEKVIRMNLKIANLNSDISHKLVPTARMTMLKIITYVDN